MGIRTRRFENFAKQETRALLSLFRRALNDEETAQDLLQETLLTAWKHRASYDTARPLKNWIFQIGLNHMRGHLRKQRRERETMGPLTTEPAKGERPSAFAKAKEQRALLEQSIRALPERQRVMVLLRYQEDLSCGEIGELVEATANAVSIQLHHARRAMRKSLNLDDADES